MKVLSGGGFLSAVIGSSNSFLLTLMLWDGWSPLWVIVVHLLVPLEFYKIRRRGNQILVAQRCFNNFGHFLSLLEFGQRAWFHSSSWRFWGMGGGGLGKHLERSYFRLIYFELGEQSSCEGWLFLWQLLVGRVLSLRPWRGRCRVWGRSWRFVGWLVARLLERERERVVTAADTSCPQGRCFIFQSWLV